MLRKRMRFHWLGLPLFCSLLALIIMSQTEKSAAAEKAAPQSYFVYVGTYGKGIYAYRYEPVSGNLNAMGLVGEVVNPSFLATDPEHRWLYAASELEGKEPGAIAAFRMDRKTGALAFMNSRPAGGLAPCHLAVDRTSRMLIAANYTSGNVPAFPIGTDGRLGPMSSLETAQGTGVNKERQAGPHMHQVVISTDNRLAYIPDLGLDRIHIFRLDPGHARLSPNDPPDAATNPGSGPRHMVFSRDEKYAYVIHELKPEVGVFSRDASNGALTRVQTVSSVPEGFTGKSDPAEILMAPSGDFVYASNRTCGTIAVFAVNHSDGKLKQIEVIEAGGTKPRGMEIDPGGHVLFVGDQGTNRFALFHIDEQTGKLAATGRHFQVPSPVAFHFVPVE